MRPGLWQIVLIVVLIFILFGSSKIPDMMRNLAGGIKVFKNELKDEKESSQKKKAVSKKSAGKKAPVKKTAVKKTTKK